MLRRLAIALAATVVLALPAAAHASPFLPPSGKVFWGGQGGYTRGKIADFASQSGKHAAEVAQAGADGRLLPVGEPEEGLPALGPPALAQGAAPGGPLEAPHGRRARVRRAIRALVA
jgi:hypothetical protein